jgi:uncharacterized protein (TIGR03000 family)
MRTRFVGWLMLFGGGLALLPAFQTPAAGFGRCRQQQPCCIQYVYCPVYIERDGGSRRAENKPQVHFFLIMDTKEVYPLGLEIEKTERKIRELHADIPREFRGEIGSANPDMLTAQSALRELREFERRYVMKDDTLLVFCNVHGERQEKENGKKEGKEGAATTQAAPAGQDLLMWSMKRAQKEPGLKNRPESERRLSRRELLAALEDSGARLRLLITDSCFVPTTASTRFGQARRDYFDIVDDMQPQPMPPPEEFKELDPKSYRRELIEDLFLNHKGLLDMNSAAEGQIAIARAFGQSFPEMARGAPKYDYDLTWEAFYNQLQGRVNKRLNSVLTLPEFKGTDAQLKSTGQVRRTADGKEEFFQTVTIFPQTDAQGKARRDASGTPALTIPKRSRWTDDVKTNTTTPPRTPPRDGQASAAPPSASMAFGSPPPAAPVTSLITVNIPAGAALYLNDTPTKQTTATRYFQSPPLQPGQTVTYTFRGDMTVDGQTQTQTKDVAVTGGKDVEVTFDGLRAPARPVAGREATNP